VHAVEDTGGDGDDVFECAGEFDAQEVVVGVDAEVGGGEELLELEGEGLVVGFGRDDGGGGDDQFT